MTATNLGLGGNPIVFRGAYVKSVNANLGLTQNAGSCSITLAEDPDNGVIFNPPNLGSFVDFTVGNIFKFSGIVTKYDRDIRNVSGRYITVNIADTREIMRNMPVILAPGYAGILSVINTTKCSVIDVYGAYNQDGFNFSGWNQSGMTFDSVRKALRGGTVTVEGIPEIIIEAQEGLAFGERYTFNIDDLATKVSLDYRINSNLSSMADLIQELSATHSFDWYIETTNRAYDTEIKIKIINRGADNIDIDLAGFLADNSGIVVTATSGVELRNDIACAVIVGAPVEGMRTFNITAGANSPIDLSDLGGNPEYLMSEVEMRVVLGGKETWRTWAKLSITSGVASKIYGIDSIDFRPVVIPATIDDPSSAIGKWANKRTVERIEEIKEINAQTKDSVAETVGKLYERLKAAAETVYGKRFLFTGSSDVDYVDSAWTVGVVVGNPSPPPGGGSATDPNEFFRNDEGKTRCYVEFTPATQQPGTVVDVNQSNLGLGIGGGFSAGRAGNDVDLNYFNGDNFLLGDVLIDAEKQNHIISGGSLFVAATIEDNRNVVRLENGVFGSAADIKAAEKLFDSLTESNEDDQIDEANAEGDIRASTEVERDRIKRVYGNVASFTKIFGLAYQPSLVHVPTRSKFSRYGPVFATNPHAEGVLTIDQDDGFSPWEFGSTSLMLDAMQFKVNNQASSVKEIESASITLEGYPILNIGDSLGRNSNINSINMSLSNPVTTTYTLQSFQRKFGELTKQELAELSIFARRGGTRNIPQDMVAFIEKYRNRNSRKFGGRGTMNTSTEMGGAFNFE